ncbi:MAG TPA: hypothetical protein VFW33_11980, partial [Gemmataceae bacterium]|nr:hypothetical protein [Gemmataceae bacterium]
MRRWGQQNERLTTEEAFERLTTDDLKPLAKMFVPRLPTRKSDLVAVIAGQLRDPEDVRTLYEQLPELGRKAVQEATYDLRGQLHPDRFQAKYGALPEFSEPAPEEDRYAYYSYRRTHPTRLRLFFPDHKTLPTDLRETLRSFVPPPPEYQLPVRDELPAHVELTHRVWTGRKPSVEVEEVPLRARLTAREAEHDVKAVLRLIDVGTVRVTDKKRQPTAAAIRAVAGVLQGGDFYTEEDQEDYGDDPAADLAIKSFAWLMIVQAAG